MNTAETTDRAPWRVRSKKPRASSPAYAQPATARSETTTSAIPRNIG